MLQLRAIARKVYLITLSSLMNLQCLPIQRVQLLSLDPLVWTCVDQVFFWGDPVVEFAT